MRRQLQLPSALIVVGAVLIIFSIFTRSEFTITELAPPTPTRDAAMRLPGFPAFIAEHPTGWEHRIAPSMRSLLLYQRWIGEHGTIVGASDEEHEHSYLNPRVLTSIIEWDGTDLY
ncbi:MAG: hypothetical protein LC737_05640, partial [Chloroflexi bacterium]|nr:hypothetical protein [Chloroflexota bacterium]